MQVYLLTIGDEILVGQIVDTNSANMARQLTLEGIEVAEKSSVADSTLGIRAGLDRALATADVVLTTGGLGPTKDDITKKVLADYFGTELRFHAPTWERMERFFERFGRQPKEVHRQQCYLPAAAEILVNKMGTAPGMWFEREGKVLAAMPGVPYEMQYLMEEEILPRLRQRRRGPRVMYRTLLTAGAGETDIAALIEEVEAGLPDYLHLAYLPNLGTVRVRITGRHVDETQLRTELDYWYSQMRERLDEFLFGMDEDTLSSAVGRMLRQRQLRLGTAESCTGGYLAHQITAVSGSSDYFMGSIIAYSNELKQRLLQVQATTLEAHGAVSEATVLEMVRGGLETLDVDLVLATSGIAGPGGGTPDKPVGTIWLAVGNKTEQQAYLIRAGKDRVKNIEFATNQALNLLRKFVRKHYPQPAVEANEDLSVR